MPIARLNKRTIEAARKANPGKAIVLWDEGLKGFGIRIAPSGRASWCVLLRIGSGGRGAKFSKRYFADYETLEPEKARATALQLLGEIRSGTDLSEVRRNDRRKALDVYASGKLGDVFAKFYERNAKDGRYWREVKRRFEVEIIPALGRDTLIARISKQDILTLIDTKEAKTKSGARLTFAALNPFFKWCVSKDLIAASPMANLIAPKSGIKARDRVLSDDEIKLAWKAFDATRYPYGPFYKLLLLTAQRRDEVSGMQWSEIDMNAGTWIIPKERTKNGKEHLVHLSPQAVEVLASIPGSGSFVFCTTARRGENKGAVSPISAYSQAKDELDEIAGIATPWRIHDLRRTAATGMASLNVPPHVVERVLNHISGSTGGLVAVYQRFEYAEERKKALFAWANYVTKLVSNVSDNVIHFRG